MEPDVRKFLTILMQSISMMLLWMLMNTFFGIKLGYLFLDEKITVWHGVYYVGMIVSFVFVMRYILKQWRQMPAFDVENASEKEQE